MVHESAEGFLSIVFFFRWRRVWEKPMCPWRVCEHARVLHLSVSYWIPDHCHQDRVPRSHTHTHTHTHTNTHTHAHTLYKMMHVFTGFLFCLCQIWMSVWPTVVSATMAAVWTRREASTVSAMLDLKLQQMAKTVKVGLISGTCINAHRDIFKGCFSVTTTEWVTFY